MAIVVYAELGIFCVISTFCITSMPQIAKITWNTPSFECIHFVEEEGCAAIWTCTSIRTNTVCAEHANSAMLPVKVSSLKSSRIWPCSSWLNSLLTTGTCEGYMAEASIVLHLLGAGCDLTWSYMINCTDGEQPPLSVMYSHFTVLPSMLDWHDTAQPTVYPCIEDNPTDMTLLNLLYILV